MSSVTLLVLASFFVGAFVGALLLYLFHSATVEQTKARYADELHRLIEREERAGLRRNGRAA